MSDYERPIPPTNLAGWTERWIPQPWTITEMQAVENERGHDVQYKALAERADDDAIRVGVGRTPTEALWNLVYQFYPPAPPLTRKERFIRAAIVTTVILIMVVMSIVAWYFPRL